MSAKRKQPTINLSTFTPLQRGPAAGTILGMGLGIQPKEETENQINAEIKEVQSVEDKPVEKVRQDVTELVKETVSVKTEPEKSASVEKLISGLKKDSFVSRHQKESFYIENDLHETFFDVTSGTKSAKTTLINLALKEFFENNDIEIRKFTGQYATGTRRKKKEES